MAKKPAFDFDLIVIGHSMPLKDREALVRALRLRCTTPILALTRSNEPALAGTDYSFDTAENPARLLETVQKTFSKQVNGLNTGTEA